MRPLRVVRWNIIERIQLGIHIIALPLLTNPLCLRLLSHNTMFAHRYVFLALEFYERDTERKKSHVTTQTA